MKLILLNDHLNFKKIRYKKFSKKKKPLKQPKKIIIIKDRDSCFAATKKKIYSLKSIKIQSVYRLNVRIDSSQQETCVEDCQETTAKNDKWIKISFVFLCSRASP